MHLLIVVMNDDSLQDLTTRVVGVVLRLHFGFGIQCEEAAFSLEKEGCLSFHLDGKAEILIAGWHLKLYLSPVPILLLFLRRLQKIVI